MNPSRYPFPVRRKPPQAVFTDPRHPTIVFVTLGAKDRARWVAGEEAHSLLVKTWRPAAGWLVGNYVLMPDHLHLFAASGKQSIALEGWFLEKPIQPRPSARGLDMAAERVSSSVARAGSYSQKWLYAKANPVRAGLVKEIGQWPCQGSIHELRW